MRRRAGALALSALLLVLAGCSTAPKAEGVRDVRIPDGATAQTVGTTLKNAHLIEHPRLFALYTRLRGTTRKLKAGHYRFQPGASWDDILAALERGVVVTLPLTIPEGYRLKQIAPRIARLAGVPAESVSALAEDSTWVRELGVPGPSLEGYLFPDTYRFSEGTDPRTVLRTMVRRYKRFWGEAERRRADSLGLSEREVVTLASIVEAETRRPEERPLIAGVYLNRLKRGMLLQADPTVQYALGEPRERLLYRDIARVADNPYNTYTHSGLPPGPIGSPGNAALRAVLQPADAPYLFFVARPDGSHFFSTTEREHNNAKNRIRRGMSVPQRSRRP